MSFEEFDVVRLRRPLPEFALPAGSVGAVLIVHKNGLAYEVEFCDEEGRTLALLTLNADDLEEVDP